MKSELLFVQTLLISSILIALVGYGCNSNDQNAEIETNPENPDDSISFGYEDIAGIGYAKDVSRRDPSDIIQAGDDYYIWYTRIPATTGGQKTRLYNSGYYGTIWYATSSDGYTWIEKGKALGPGEKGAFDSHAVFTPNILKYEDKYYLYYTGVKPTPGNPDNEFQNNAETDVTAIGLAVSYTPDGPFERIATEPILKISEDAAQFDSYRIDDASVVVKDKAVWLYYKGRSRIHGPSGPRKTRMGVAFADKPQGPYVKYVNPLVDKSHEVLIWNHAGGVASLASIDRSINMAPDGLNFSIIQENLVQIPTAPGLYRPHLTDHSIKEMPGWGISHKVKDGDIYLVRFKMQSNLE